MLGQVGNGGDLVAIDGDDLVADFHAGRLCLRILGEHCHFRRRYDLAVGEVERSDDGDGEQQVRQWPGQHDQRALPQGLHMESLGSLLRGQPILGGRWGAGGIHVAGELDVAAQRQRRELPAGSTPVGPAGDLLAEANRERVGLHTEQPSDEVVSQLMDQHKRAKHEQKRENRRQQVG